MPTPKNYRTKRQLPTLRRKLMLFAASDWFYLALLVLIAFSSHAIWFAFGTTLTHTDWYLWSNDATKQALHAAGSWKDFSGFGSPNIQLSFYFVTSLWAFIAHLGGSFSDAVKLTLLIPIAVLGFVAPYIFLRQISSDKFIAFCASLFYGSTTYFLLRQGSHLPIAFIYAFSPIILTFFVRALRSLRARDWLLFATAYSIGLFYETRIMYILTFALVLYGLLFVEKKFVKKYLVLGVLTALIIVGLNSFWILPTLSGAGSAIQSVTSRSIFGNDLFDLQHAIALSGSGWTGGIPDESFILQPIQIYLWLIPLIALSSLPFIKNLKPIKRKYLIFFIVLTLIGIFLTKQATPPFSNAYSWLYAHFPGFSLFRESSKFYLLTALGYMGVLGIGLLAFKNSFRYFFGFLIIIIALLNLTPLITQNYGTMFVNRHIPKDYKLVNNLIAKDPGVFRTLWVPLDSRWGYFDQYHPRAGAVSLLQADWKAFNSNNNESIYQQIKSLINRPMTEGLMASSSIKYLIVPLRDTANDDDFIKYFGDNESLYVDLLNKTPWLQKLDIGTKQVAVYKNKNFNQYIAASKQLDKLSTLNNLDSYYNFTKTQFNQLPLNFNLQGGSNNLPARSVNDIFFDLKNNNMQKNVISFNAADQKSNNNILYANTNNQSLSYEFTGGNLTVFGSNANNLYINSKPISDGVSNQTLMNTGLASGQNYYFVRGDNPMPVNEGRHLIGRLDQPIELFIGSTKNLIPNPSFEAGAWLKEVIDCNNHDNRSLIGMGIDKTTHTDGKQSLQLSAFNHIACTGPLPIKVNPSSDYLLSFDYKAAGTNETGYQIMFNDPANTNISEQFAIKDNQWRKFSKTIKTPNGATSLILRIKGFPNEQRQTKAITNFDNLTLEPLISAAQINSAAAPNYKQQKIKPSDKIEYIDPSLNMANMLPNHSFEQGPWQKTVGDCNNYDKNPILNMEVNNKYATDGQKSLQLEATRHTACTSNAADVAGNNKYYLSFDYQSPNTKTATYYIAFNDPAKTVYTESIPITNTKWNRFGKTFTAPYGASKMTVTLYAYSGSNNKKIINRYDNVRIVNVPDIQNTYYIVSQPTGQLAMPASVNYSPLNPAKKLVHIKGASTPFYLNMSEAYHPKWQLELNNKKSNGMLSSWSPIANPNIVPASMHYKLDDFLNGWYVDPAELCKGNKAGCTKNADGSYDLEMIAEFTPQRWFYAGSVISAVTFVGCLGYLAYDWRQRRGNRIYKNMDHNV